MIKKITLLSLMASAFALTACSEQAQVAGGKMAREKSYVAADNKFVEKGWTSGDQVSWEKQLKTRSQGQDDYSKAK